MSATGEKMQLQKLVDFWETAGDMACICLERGYYSPCDPDFCWIAVLDSRKKGSLKNKITAPIIKCLCGRYVKARAKPDKAGLLEKFICPCCDLSVDFKLDGWIEMFGKTKRELAGEEEY